MNNLTKDLQQKSFELLKVFTQVCEKLNVKYYLVEGTLLGAVRHKGFIPWDDDIDVVMLREEIMSFQKHTVNLFVVLASIITRIEDELFKCDKTSGAWSLKIDGLAAF